MDVCFFEVFSEERAAIKKYLPKSWRVRTTPKTIQDTSISKIPAIISIRTQSRIPRKWCAHLKAIQTRSSGYDHLVHLRRRHPRIKLGYLPSYCARSVAEQALLLTLALARKLKLQTKHYESFNRNGLTGTELLGKNLFVIGVGHIGREVVKLAKGIGFKVSGFDRVKRVPSLRYTSLKQGLKQADFVICALSLGSKTKNLLAYRTLKHTKRGAVLINIARGELTPLRDLKRLLAQNILSGVGLDVHADEARLAHRLQKGHRGKAIALARRPNILFTPHNAFNTREALDRKARDSVYALKAFARMTRWPHPIPIST